MKHSKRCNCEKCRIKRMSKPYISHNYYWNLEVWGHRYADSIEYLAGRWYINYHNSQQKKGRMSLSSWNHECQWERAKKADARDGVQDK